MDTQEEIDLLKHQLNDIYSPVGLMTLAEVSEVIRKSPGTISLTLASTLRRRQGWAQHLLKGKVRMGRSIFFKTSAVAACVVLGDCHGN